MSHHYNLPFYLHFYTSLLHFGSLKFWFVKERQKGEIRISASGALAVVLVGQPAVLKKFGPLDKDQVFLSPLRRFKAQVAGFS